MDTYMAKSINFEEFINTYITKDDSSQNIIYIGVGTAANAKSKGNVLEAKDQQQYLPFLQNIKSIFPYIHIHLVLIDPELKNPPYCVQPDIRYFENTDPYSIPINDWIRDYDYDNIYHNRNKITVYTIREAVYYKEECNIIDNLRKLNKYLIDNNDILLFHDFTGRDTHALSYMFDNELSGNKDRIIYDITLRFDGTCYVDLLNELFYLNIELRGEDIVLLNPFNLSNIDIINNIKETTNDNYKKQLMIALNNKILIFTDKIYPFYRKYYVLHKNIISNKISRESIENILCRSEYDNFFEIASYTGYYDIKNDMEFLKYYLDVDLETIAEDINNMMKKLEGYMILYVSDLLSISCNDPLKVAEQLFERISYNPYKWGDIIKDNIYIPLKNRGIYIREAPFIDCYL